jgi:hypothetical protein
MFNKLLAEAASIPLAPEGGFQFKEMGPLGTNPAVDAGTRFNTIMSSVIGIITVIGFIWFIFLLIMGAIGIMSSGGDKAQAETARKKITSGLIGLVVLIAGLFLFDLFGSLLGIPDVLNPAKWIEELSPKTPPAQQNTGGGGTTKQPANLIY